MNEAKQADVRVPQTALGEKFDAAVLMFVNANGEKEGGTVGSLLAEFNIVEQRPEFIRLVKVIAEQLVEDVSVKTAQGILSGTLKSGDGSAVDLLACEGAVLAAHALILGAHLSKQGVL